MAANSNFNWEDRDAEFENQDITENATDLKIGEEDFIDLLVAPADWTIGTLYSQIGHQIDLDPDFQRRNVWNEKAKSSFIESLFLGIPIPQILLSQRKKMRNSFIVLDGKQRLLTIKEFLDGRHTNGRKFKLKGLRILKQLEGMDWEQIQSDESIVATNLLNETQRTTVLRGWEKESVLYEIFYRLNSGSVKLSPMELRTSLYPGGFLKFIVKWTETIGPLHHLLKKRQPDARMSDVELCVRYLAFDDDRIGYTGDLKKFLDTACSLYNIEWGGTTQRHIENTLGSMNLAIDAGMNIFGDSFFCRKFSDGKFEHRFNRAIFDIMIRSLSQSDFQNWALDHKQEVVSAFQELSENNNDFVRSIETTTKSIESTTFRFQFWLEKVKEISGIKIRMPIIKDEA